MVLALARLFNSFPEFVVQVWIFLDMFRLKVVSPQHHQVMLDLLCALLLDDDRAGLEVVVVGVVILLQRLQARQRLDLGLRGVIDTAVQVTVSMGRGCVGEESMQHGLNLPFGGGRQPSLPALARALLQGG